MIFSVLPGVPADGAVATTSTGCTFPDSALVRITVDGTITAETNPLYSCCFSAQPNRDGVYGPMGGGTPTNWQNLLVRVPIIFGNLTSTTLTGWPTLPFGNSSPTVVVFEGSYIGKQGSAVFVQRYKIDGAGSCTTHPPPTPPGCVTPGGLAYSYSALAYVLTGQQTITVKRIARTLEVTAVPDTAYLGDTIAFRASSTDGRTVSVREWIWKDTTGALSSVPCSGTSPVCKFAPAISGVMFVRARVGTNTFIEQAQTEANLYFVPCPQGDPLLDNLTVRNFLRELDSLSASVSPPLEARGYVFQDTLTGKYSYRIDWPNSANKCWRSDYGLGQPANTRVVVSGHSHPYSLGDQVCTGKLYTTGIYARLPSREDWEIAFNNDIPGVIIDKDVVVRYSVPPSLDTITVRVPQLSPPVQTRVGPPHSVINSLVNTKTRFGVCAFP